MMSFKKFNLMWAAILSMVIFTSCKKEEDPEPENDEPFTIEVFASQVTENSAEGTSAGYVNIKDEDGDFIDDLSDFSFSLIEENPEGAIKLVVGQGNVELQVADASIFDYEQRTAVAAKFRAKRGSVTKSSTFTVSVLDQPEGGTPIVVVREVE